jgi:hypothetical protein
LVGVGGGGFELGAAHDNAGIRLLCDMQKHVWVLFLRPFRSVALGVGIGRDVKRVQPHDAIDSQLGRCRAFRLCGRLHLRPRLAEPVAQFDWAADAMYGPFGLASIVTSAMGDFLSFSNVKSLTRLPTAIGPGKRPRLIAIGDTGKPRRRRL